MKKFLILTLFLVSLFFVVSPLPVHAQGKAWGDCVDANGVASLKCIPVVFGNLISAALEFVGTVAVFLIVYAGITFVRSGGDPKQTAAAQKIITYAIIGLVVVLSSFAIIYFISYTTGVKCITNLALNC